jgi:hypothetical protein
MVCYKITAEYLYKMIFENLDLYYLIKDNN